MELLPGFGPGTSSLPMVKLHKNYIYKLGKSMILAVKTFTICFSYIWYDIIHSMIRVGSYVCPKCGGSLKYYDTIRRKVLSKRRSCIRLYIKRFRCLSCGALHNEIPEVIFPYKHYEAEIIRGVQESLITSSTLGFEDYPCEATMRSWISRKKQAII